jgi:hypothetical protein
LDAKLVIADVLAGLYTYDIVNSSILSSDTISYSFTFGQLDDEYDTILADSVVVDASGFSGELSGSDTDLQTALETLDAINHIEESTTVTDTDNGLSIVETGNNITVGLDFGELDAGTPVTGNLVAYVSVDSIYEGWDVVTSAPTLESSDTPDATGFNITWASTDGTSYVHAGSSYYDQYTLSTAYDFTTASRTGRVTNTFNTSPVAFNADGTKMYAANNTDDDFYQYTLTGSAWDITSRTLDGTYAEGSSTFTAIRWANSGSDFFALDNSDDELRHYTCTTPYDVTSGMSYSESYTVSDESIPYGFDITEDGTKLFLVGLGDDDVLEYSFGTPYDVSTLTLTGQYDPTTASPTGIHFNSDGTKFAMQILNSDARLYDITALTGVGVESTPKSVDAASLVTDSAAIVGYGFVAGAHTADSGWTLDADSITVTGKRVGIGIDAPLDDFHVVGSVEIDHTAVGSDEHALEIYTDAAGIGDIKAVDIVYITGAISDGDNEAISLITIDESAATGGDIYAYEILATEGSANVYGIGHGVGVNPIYQLVGSFANGDTAYVNGTDRLTEFNTSDIGGANNVTFFAADNDSILIGSTAKFSEIEFLLETAASGAGVQPEFWYSTGVDAYTQFTPIDGTNGMRNSGVVQWQNADIASWALSGSYYLIKVVRTQNGLSTAPVEDQIKISATTEYDWDKDGKVTVNNVDAQEGVVERLTFTAGETVVAGDICYLESDGKMWLALAEIDTTAQGLLGIATTGIAAEGSGSFQLKGKYTTSGLTTGAEYFIDPSTGGDWTTTKPSATNEIVRLVGYALSTTVLYFDPDKTWTEIP